MRENWTEDDSALAGAISVVLGNLPQEAHNAVLAHVAIRATPAELEIVKNIVIVDEINDKWPKRRTGRR